MATQVTSASIIKEKNKTIINKQIKINIKLNKNKTKAAYKTIYFSHHIPIIS